MSNVKAADASRHYGMASVFFGGVDFCLLYPFKYISVVLEVRRLGFTMFNPAYGIRALYSPPYRV